jgi:hypothetical protein
LQAHITTSSQWYFAHFEPAASHRTSGGRGRTTLGEAVMTQWSTPADMRG